MLSKFNIIWNKKFQDWCLSHGYTELSPYAGVGGARSQEERSGAETLSPGDTVDTDTEQDVGSGDYQDYQYDY